MWLKNYYPFMCGNNSGKNSRELRKYAEYENNRQWQDVFNRLVSIAINIYEWENLPETCDPYFFETILLWQAQACIINDPVKGGFLSLPATPASQMNIYYQNTYWRAYSLGYSKKFLALNKWNKDIYAKATEFISDSEDNIPIGCVCLDNEMSYPLIETVRMYTDKLVDVMRAIDVKVKQLKLGFIIETDEASKLAIQSAIKDVDQNVLAVYARRDIAKALKESKAINTGSTPQELETLWNHYNNVMSAFLTAFGINNLNTADKKERLLSDEVNSNNEAIQLNAAYRLDQRLHFCENFNAVFGTNVTCKMKHSYENAVPENTSNKQTTNESKEGSET